MLICFRMVWLFLNRWRQTKFEYGLHSMLEYQCVNKHKPKCNLLSLSRVLFSFSSLSFAISLSLCLFLSISVVQALSSISSKQSNWNYHRPQIKWIICFFMLCVIRSWILFLFHLIDPKKKTFRENDSNSVDVLCIYLSIVRCSFIVSILNLGMAVFLFRK